MNESRSLFIMNNEYAQLTLSSYVPYNLMINFGLDKGSVTLTDDGRIEIAGEYSPSAAALAFWEALAYYNPIHALREENERLTLKLKEYHDR